MGSYANINIGKYNFWWHKNGFGNLLYIFNQNDYKKVVKKDENEEVHTYHKLITNVKKAKQILDSTGFTIELAEKNFNEALKLINFDDDDEIIYYFNLYSEKDLKNIELIKQQYNFKNWKETITLATNNLIKYGKNILKDSFDISIKNLKSENILHRLILESLSLNPPDLYWGIPIELLLYNANFIMRVILDEIDDNELIELDYTDLVDGGYCDETLPIEAFDIQKTIILTEGKTDRDYIKDSIDLLYPHLSKCFAFINFTYGIEGSVDFLPRYIKIFAGTGITNNIIGLFDNDTAGRCAKKTLKKYVFPSNIKLMNLPEIELAKKMEVIDSKGNISIRDINGIACSIELFFGKDILKKENSFEKIELKDFRKEVNEYQGAIQNKGNIQKRFDKKIKIAQKNGIKNIEDWNEMIILIESLINIWKS